MAASESLTATPPRRIERIIEGPRWVQATAFASIALTIELFGVIDQTIPFVYFQF